VNKGKRIQILDTSGVEYRLERIAMQILEDVYPLKKVIFVGIDVRGRQLAEKIKYWIALTKAVEVEVYEARPERSGYSSSEIHLPDTLQAGNDIPIVIVDDVLYSGRTLFLALEKIMQFQPLRVRMAVLIDRGHRRYPLRADYTGMELGTTLQEHVSVEIDTNQEISAWLFS